MKFRRSTRQVFGRSVRPATTLGAVALATGAILSPASAATQHLAVSGAWDTTSPTWDRWTWVGDATQATMTGLVVDNWFFGVSAVSTEGNESVVSFPRPFR